MLKDCVLIDIWFVDGKIPEETKKAIRLAKKMHKDVTVLVTAELNQPDTEHTDPYDALKSHLKKNLLYPANGELITYAVKDEAIEKLSKYNEPLFYSTAGAELGVILD